MLQPCMVMSEEGTRAKSFISFALSMVAKEMKGKIFSNPADEYAVVFYSTKVAKNASSLSSTYEYLSLGPSDASRIQQVGKGISASSFESEVGSLSLPAAIKNEALRMGLWASSSLLNNKTRSRKTIYLLTNNDTPCGPGWEPADNDPVIVRAEELKNARVTLQLLPLPPLDKLFDIKKGWLEILVANRGANDEEEDEGEGEEGEKDPSSNQEEGFFELSSRSQLVEDFSYLQDMANEKEDISRIESVEVLVRKRLVRKRAVARTKWRLTSSTTISVHLFNLVQTKLPPATAHYHAITNRELKSERKVVDSRTGAVLKLDKDVAKEAAKEAAALLAPEGGPSTAVAAAGPSSLAGPSSSSMNVADGIKLVQVFEADVKKTDTRFPPQIVVEKDLLLKIKGITEPGLNLLGFKPRSCLKLTHQIGQASFVRPSDKEIKGSITTFKALLDAMIKEEVMAICGWRRTKASDLRLVALLPQREVKNNFGVQIFAEGFCLCPLPFVDDIRRPEVTEFSLKGIPVVRASQEMIEAAAAVIDKLGFGKDPLSGKRLFPLADVPNPNLARHLQVIEARAMGMEIPEMEDEDDLTIRDEEFMRESAADLIQILKDLCWGENANPDGEKGKKRKAEKEAVKAGCEEAYMLHDWESLAERQGAEGLEGLTLDKLKIYLLYSHLPVSGKKADVCERIRNHIRSKVA